ncbi:MAG: PaaI family thioesterase [Betaproteobacteria bacterium]|nr:PaaI family thioesterase [Betaproteobacteria bacterium]
MSVRKPGKAALQQLLDRARFIGGYRFKLVAVTDKECTIAMPFRRTLERPGGTVNGPAFMAAADCVMWLAIKRHIGIEHDAVTSELNTAFLNAARRETVYCSARILKLGKRLIYGIAECHDRRGKIFTHHSVTYVRI